MDIFSDLPEPCDSNQKLVPVNLLDEPQATTTDKHTSNLFSDLPSANEKKDDSFQLSANDRKDTNQHQTGEKRWLESGDDGDYKRQKSECVYRSLEGFYAERQGERDDMQDFHVIIDDFSSEVSGLHNSISRLAFYAVYDGHGGARASKFAAENLHKQISQKYLKGDITSVEKEMKKMFTDVYKKTDEAFLKQASKTKPSWKDGSTATTVLVVNDTIYIANLGDSKAILCRHDPENNKDTALTLTKDHNPTLYDERIRIQKAGGSVKDGRVLGQLEVSRSIGDGPYKAYGVSCVPDIKRCQLTDNDKYLVIACDGLWKSFSSADCVVFINKILQDPNLIGTSLKSEKQVKYETACSKIASEAVKRLSADNVTVVIVAINKES